MPIIPNRVFLLARCMKWDYAEDMFYNIVIRHAEYDDDKDDNVFLIPHSDSVDVILKNEEKDTYYYLKDNYGYKAPSFDALYGGFPPGLVNVCCWKKKENIR